MSKVKDYLLPAIQAYQELEMWIGYEEYLKSCDQDPTAIELDHLEQEYLAKSQNQIVAHAANNINYNHPKGT